jgi:short-subunit dehydrogenase
MSESTTAVVTGAGRGIGLAIARRLAAAGHRVLLTDIDAEAARRAAADVGMGAWGTQQDVRDPSGHRDIAAQASAAGRLAVWVNNAGILIAGESWTHTDQELMSILDINVRGVLAGSHAAIGSMGRAGGGILNIASISALVPLPGLAVYAATKAAVLSFTTSLQGDLDHAGLPIRARALCPDVVGTQMVSSRATDPGAALLFSGPKPLAADDVARAGLQLLESRQIFRVVPRWRGVVARSTDVAPSLGLKTVALMRTLGERRQRKSI